MGFWGLQQHRTSSQDACVCAVLRSLSGALTYGRRILGPYPQDQRTVGAFWAHTRKTEAREAGKPVGRNGGCWELLRPEVIYVFNPRVRSGPLAALVSACPPEAREDD